MYNDSKKKFGGKPFTPGGNRPYKRRPEPNFDKFASDYKAEGQNSARPEGRGNYNSDTSGSSGRGGDEKSSSGKTYVGKSTYSKSGSYGDKPYGEKRAFAGKSSFGGFKKSKPYGEKTYGDKPAYADKPAYSDKPAYGEKKTYGDKPSFGEKRSFGDKPAYGERRSYGDKPSYGGGERRGFGGGRSGGGYGGDRASTYGTGMRRPMQKSRRVAGTTIDIKLLINKVNDDAFIKPVEHVLQHQFKDFALDQRLKDNITKKGYISPTPIQDVSIPVGLEGKDVIGLANTGSGKTAAFLIPLINKMLGDRSQKAIILTPTRELAAQIHDELKDFGRGFNLNAVLCIGGSNIVAQGRMLKSPFSFIIGTPGRVMDLMDRKWLYLDRFQNVVLDEADRMVDMGFINDMKMILGKLPKQRQSLFFTATMDKSVETLIGQFLTNPVKVSVKTRDTSANIEQDIVHVPNDKNGKMDVLIELLRQPAFDKVLVFGRTKFGVEKISKSLLAAGVKADSIHGDKSQNYRMKALQRFKRDEVQVLCATDVAARGLDINGVSHVINFDVPANYEDYIHRIGRTGRADKKGVALTFVTGQR